MKRCLLLTSLFACAAPSPHAPPAPPSGMHAFATVDSSWTHEKQRLEDQGDGEAWRVVPPANQVAGRAYPYEIRFFAADKTVVKIMTYRESGSLLSETDRAGARTFSRSFYADGSFASYEEWDSRGLVSGSSQDPSSTTRTSFSGGHGQLTLWRDRTHVKRLWIDGGREYVTRTLTGDHVDRTQLSTPAGDMWIRTNGVETLFLPGHREAWTRAADDTVSAQIMASAVNGETGAAIANPGTLDDIGRDIERWSRPVDASRGAAPDPALYQALVADYAVRRAEVVASMRSRLETSGPSLAELGLSPP